VIALLLAIGLSSLGLQADQESSSARPEPPQDARELLAWHLQTIPDREAALALLRDPQAAPKDRERMFEDFRWQAYLLLQAGAEGELLPLLDALADASRGGADLLSPELARVGLADVQRFRIQASCWSPEHYRQGLELANSWIQQEGASNSAAAASVADMSAFLDERLGVHQGIRRRAQAVLWYPLLSLLLLAASGRLLWRRWT